MWYQNIGSVFFRFVTKHACNRRTDEQNYDSRDCASIAVSYGQNVAIYFFLRLNIFHHQLSIIFPALYPWLMHARNLMSVW